MQISSRKHAAEKTSRGDGTASLRAVHNTTSTWNPPSRGRPRQAQAAQQTQKEEAAASPDAMTAAARHSEPPLQPDEITNAISTDGAQSADAGHALSIIDEPSAVTAPQAAVQNTLTATIAGLERRIEDDCVSLSQHYLQAIVGRESLCLLVHFYSWGEAGK